MNIVILGGNGFVGKSLKEYLESFDNWKITAVGHNEVDVSSKEQITEFFKNKYVDCVIDAAVACNCEKEIERNVQMYKNLEKCSSSYGRLIFFGSGAEYDKSLDIVDVDEEAVRDRVSKDAYGLAKKEIRQLVEQSEKAYDLRIFGLYGKYEDYRRKFITGCCAKSVLGLPLTIRQNVYFDFLYIDDFCRMVKAFIELDSPKYHTYNIVSGKKIDLLSLAKIVKEKSGEDLPIIVAKEGFANEYTANGDRLHNEINYHEFVSHEQAIDELIAYFEERKELIEDVKNNI